MYCGIYCGVVGVVKWGNGYVDDGVFMVGFFVLFGKSGLFCVCFCC